MGNTCATPRRAAAVCPQHSAKVAAAAADIHTPHIEFNEAYVAGDEYRPPTPSGMPQRWGAADDRTADRVAAAMGL
jgi:hypothetical protein